MFESNFIILFFLVKQINKTVSITLRFGRNDISSLDYVFMYL